MVPRLAVLVLLLVVVSLAVFSLLYITSGSVLDTLLGTNPRTPAEIRYLTNEYHLNKPFLTQYRLSASQAAVLWPPDRELRGAASAVGGCGARFVLKALSR